ncbi:hypothetical protein GCM10010166_62790 [Couchioplanes caeruleus subsp. azureus]|nr:hypothetical protein GCM10010166_62790 [Couchioplanes caeruleus subsp. azureus]
MAARAEATRKAPRCVQRIGHRPRTAALVRNEKSVSLFWMKPPCGYVVHLLAEIPIGGAHARIAPFGARLYPSFPEADNGRKYHILITEFDTAAIADIERGSFPVIPPRWVRLIKSANSAYEHLTGH